MLLPGEEFYLQSFWALDSERSVSMVIGRIPWSKTMDFAARKGLDESNADLFWQVISGLDEAYRHWMKKEHERSLESSKTKKGAGGKTKSKRSYAR